MGIALDGFGDGFGAGDLGTATSTDRPTTPGAYQTSGSGFVLKFHP